MQANIRASRALGYQQLAALGTAVGLTIPEGTSMVVIVAETQAVRWRDDGVDPTAAVGMPLAVGVEFIYTAGNLPSLKFIEQTASAKLNVSYYA